MSNEKWQMTSNWRNGTTKSRQSVWLRPDQATNQIQAIFDLQSKLQRQFKTSTSTPYPQLLSVLPPTVSTCASFYFLSRKHCVHAMGDIPSIWIVLTGRAPFTRTLGKRLALNSHLSMKVPGNVFLPLSSIACDGLSELGIRTSGSFTAQETVTRSVIGYITLVAPSLCINFLLRATQWLFGHFRLLHTAGEILLYCPGSYQHLW